MTCFFMSFTSKKNSITLEEEISCLSWAYNQADKEEEASIGGAYSWGIETWSWRFETHFNNCNNSGIPI